VFIMWLATSHPFWAAAIAIAMPVLIVAVARAVVRAVRSVFRGAQQQLAAGSGSQSTRPTMNA
jgi:hypothetical protein